MRTVKFFPDALLPRRSGLWGGVLLTPVLIATLAGCGAQAEATDGISVVASTNAWASIARAVGGDAVTVSAIIDSADKDPHEYEATARDQLAVSRADLVVENGGGYDSFVDTLLDASGADPALVIAVPDADAAESGGDEHDGAGHGHIEGVNEHVWYDLHVAGTVAEQIAAELTAIDPDDADGYAQRLESFSTELGAVLDDVDSLHEQLEGRRFLVTEPVPALLLADMGLDDVTPGAFSEAVEEDSDVPPAVLQQVLDLIADDDIAVLGYNAQTETAQTQLVRSAAEEAGVPVVQFTETLPEGTDYLAWMQDNLDRTAAALGA